LRRVQWATEPSCVLSTPVFGEATLRRRGQAGKL